MLDMSFTSGLGRTYKYWRGPAPLFEFGHGLSLSNFSLAWSPGAPPTAVKFSALTDSTTIAVTVSNVSPLDGEEVVLLYAVPVKLQRPSSEAGVRLPYKRLINFARVSVSASASASVSFAVNASACVTVNGLSALVAS